MRHPNNLKFFLCAIAAFSVGLSSGCGKNELGKNEVIAYVNREPVYLSELKREVALAARSDPLFKAAPGTEKGILNNLINRKLIIQEAMKKGLAKEERFAATIKAFWEQTLIRDFVDYKKKQFQEYLFATDDEVDKYYDNMSYRVTFKVLKVNDVSSVDAAYKKYLDDGDSSGWQTVGPLGYDDVASGVLLEAFGMDGGEAKKLYDGYYYYLVEMAAKERAEVESLAIIKSDIQKRVIAMKEARLFEDWLKTQREKGRIKINKEWL